MQERQNKISIDKRIEVLEYLHGLLDNPAQEDIKHNVQLMIDSYRDQVNHQPDNYPRRSLSYIPPAL